MNNYALISVSDKSNLEDLCKILKKFKIKIISTGQTSKHIKRLGYNCIEVSKLTKFNEILDGRVKTLHPKIHASLLFNRNNKSHYKSFKFLKFPEINFLFVNLYPFKKYIESEKKAIEMIDIGGSALLRSGAKNYKSITTISDPKDYKKFISEMNKNSGSTSIEFRKKMALKIYELSSKYDNHISIWIRSLLQNKNINLNKNSQNLRYGENPNQRAYYLSSTKNNIFKKSQLNGKKLSYNNILDIDAAINCISEFSDPTCAIIKHNNPCGVASDKNISVAFKNAYKADTKSSFGGIVALNRKVDLNLAKKINLIFFEILIAKSFTKEALNLLIKNKKIIIIDFSKINFQNKKEKKSVIGGYLIQDKNLSIISKSNLKKMSNKKDLIKNINDMVFALKVCKYTKSNSIVLVKNKQTVGIGCGQMSRIDATKVALMKLKEFNKNLRNFIVASDAFFPFNDSIKILINKGCSSIVQPGGSNNDDNLIKYVNKKNKSLYFIKNRLFKH